MADQLYSAADLYNAYKQVDAGKTGDITRILAAAPQGINGSYTLEQLKAIAGGPSSSTVGGQYIGPVRTGLSGLSSRSLAAWQGALAGLGSSTTGPGATSGINALTDLQKQQLQLESQALQQSIAFAKQRAAAGTKAGGEISDISRTLLNESTPLRQALIGSTENKLGIPLSPGATVSPVALFGPQAPERTALEDQYNQARNTAIESSPLRGGQLSQALGVSLPADRARAISGMEAGATDKAMGLATDIGLGTPPLALQGLGEGANITDTALGGASANTAGAGLGFGNTASGYNAAADRAQNLFLGQQGINLGFQQLTSQQNIASQQAGAQKKSGTGAGVGAGVGGILAGVIAAI